MKTKVHKIGNSLGVHIPKEVVKKAGLRKGSAVDVSYSNGKILIIPGREETLEDILNSINPENRQEVCDFGDDVGLEIVK